MSKKILYALSSVGVLVFFFALHNTTQAATLVLSPSSGSIVAGQTLNVDILLDTLGEPIDGVDVYYLRYNPAILEVQDANASASGTQITPGTLLGVTLSNSVNASAGTIQFSQVTSGGTTFSSSGKLATIIFKGLANGTSAVTFDFTQGSTLDTNVAGSGADKLTSVTNGSFTVTGGTAPPPPPPASNQSPVGSFDGLKPDGVTLFGWSYDPDASSTSNQVHIYINGPAGTGTMIGSVTANMTRNDVNSVYSISGNHGFEFPIPQTYHNNTPYAYYIYGINLTAGTNPQLTGSPKTFTVQALTPTPTPSTPTSPSGVPADGTLIKDTNSPAIYIVEYGTKRPFASWDAFAGLGYSLSRVNTIDTSQIAVGSPIFNPDQRHSRGNVVLLNGTVYFLGAELKYPFPSADIFFSWGHSFANVIAGNQYDNAIPAGPIVALKP